MKPHRAVLAVCALLALVLVLGPAGAASKAKKPKQPKPHASGVWVGQLERHGKHWDYVGQACPIDGLSVCAATVVRYRINPSPAAPGAPLDVNGRLNPVQLSMAESGTIVSTARQQYQAATERYGRNVSP